MERSIARSLFSVAAGGKMGLGIRWTCFLDCDVGSLVDHVFLVRCTRLEQYHIDDKHHGTHWNLAHSIIEILYR